MVKVSCSQLTLIFAASASASDLMKGFLQSLPTFPNCINRYDKPKPTLFHPPAMVASQGTCSPASRLLISGKAAVQVS